MHPRLRLTLQPNDHTRAITEVRREINERRNSTDLGLTSPADQEALATIRAENDALFSDLIVFFTSRAQAVDTVYCSMALTERDGSRVGLQKVLQAVLP
jgi:hypothetical protein